MNDKLIHRVEEWYAINGRKLSKIFDIFNFRLAFADEERRGKATIEIDGKIIGASIAFWNKGDVAALLINKATGVEYKFDDRKLLATEDIHMLLDSYIERIMRDAKVLPDS